MHFHFQVFKETLALTLHFKISFEAKLLGNVKDWVNYLTRILTSVKNRPAPIELKVVFFEKDCGFSFPMPPALFGMNVNS